MGLNASQNTKIYSKNILEIEYLRNYLYINRNYIYSTHACTYRVNILKTLQKMG